jgi:tetratricopeptide (TPR) repeat protein
MNTGHRRASSSGAMSAMALCFSILPWAPARAADDGGTQSVFATGAGNRALAMGGAFSATADDASAILWNPAGLGRVPQAEIQASQTGDMGAGIHETYGSLVLPSWRWGTFACSIRQFGVGGIEQRDDRNVLLADDLSDSETEVTLGYGRSFSESWSVGAALKLQRMSLAGYKGSGLGLDLGLLTQPAMVLGVQAPWATRLSWGLAVRNALEPSIRLDQESVHDPLAVRTGLAWRVSGRLEGLLTEIDLDKSLDAGIRMRAGMEYQWRGLAAFRLGMSNSRLTAGTGWRWKDLTADYTFENAPLAPTHRVGISLLFGSTVTESREVAYRKEDEALQRRLAEAFEQRQKEQIQELLAEAERELAARNVPAALAALAVVGTLHPDHPRARVLEASCLTAKGAELERQGEFAAAALSYERALAVAADDSLAAQGARRVRAESDRQAARSQKLREMFAQAMDAFAADDLAAARSGFEAVVREDPHDKEAERMLRRTEEFIIRRAGRQVDEAGRYTTLGMVEEAERLLARARALDPQAPGLSRATAALERARKQAHAPPGAGEKAASAAGHGGKDAPTGRHAPTGKHAPNGKHVQAARALSDREVESLYASGIAAMREGRAEDALRCWELVWSARPGYRQVKDYLKAEYLARGMEAFATGYLEKAVEHWQRAMEVDPGDPRARGYLERAQKQIARSREILGIDE